MLCMFNIPKRGRKLSGLFFSQQYIQQKHKLLAFHMPDDADDGVDGDVDDGEGVGDGDGEWQ